MDAQRSWASPENLRPAAARKPTNLSLDPALLDEARALDLLFQGV